MRSHIERSSSSPPFGGGVRGSRLAHPVMPHIGSILEQSEIRQNVDVEEFHRAVLLDEIIVKSFGSHDINGNALGNSEFGVPFFNPRNMRLCVFGWFDAFAIVGTLKHAGREILP